jgi:hypothetical protein
MISRDFGWDAVPPAVARPWSLGRTLFVAALAVAAMQALLLATSNKGVLQGILFDPDCYMHLQRALQLMLHGGWRQPLDMRINAPFGFAIHWTHLFDGLLVAGAWPLRLLGLSAHDALYLWGSAISPLLLLPGLAALAWGSRPRLPGPAFICLTGLLFTQPLLFGAFLAGRPDHHSLIMTLLLAEIGWLYAVLDERAGTRAAILAGICGGVQICTTVEGLVSVLLVCLVLGLAWMVYDRPVIRRLAMYLGAAAATIAAWLLAEGGVYLRRAAYDRVSIVHALALGLGCLCIAALTRFEAGSTRRVRVAALAAAGTAAAGLTALVFPDFFLGPWPHLDPQVKAWHAQINELQPLLPTDGEHAIRFLGQFAAALLSLPLIVLGLRRGEKTMLIPVTGLLLFGGLALAQMRWSSEVQAVTLVPWTLTVIAIMRSDWGVNVGGQKLPLGGVALMGALMLQILPALTFPVRPAALSGLNPATARDCNWGGAMPTLAALKPAGGTILTPLWFGPQILWATDLKVIGAPYEIAPALRDSEAAFATSQAAHIIAGRRHVDFIMVCGPAPGFAGELAAGRAPAWLTPQPAPAGFRLYRVRDE